MRWGAHLQLGVLPDGLRCYLADGIKQERQVRLHRLRESLVAAEAQRPEKQPRHSCTVQGSDKR
jgi:hypothetical protein